MAQISKDYAAALFALGTECGLETSFYDALCTIRDEFLANPEYAELLSCPSVPKSERASLIEEAFSKSIPEYVLSFLQVLCERGNAALLCECTEEYRKLLWQKQGVLSAKITSAVPLSEAQKAALTQKLSGISRSRIEADFEVDRALLGGIVVDMDGNIIDGSVKYRLQQVKEVIEQ